MYAQVKRDEQSSDAAIAVEKRVNGLELDMEQPGLDKGRKSSLSLRRKSVVAASGQIVWTSEPSR